MDIIIWLMIFKSLEIMKRYEYPIIFDATHSVQEPGGLGSRSGGKREFVPILSTAAISIGGCRIIY